MCVYWKKFEKTFFSLSIQFHYFSIIFFSLWTIIIFELKLKISFLTVEENKKEKGRQDSSQSKPESRTVSKPTEKEAKTFSTEKEAKRKTPNQQRKFTASSYFIFQSYFSHISVLILFKFWFFKKILFLFFWTSGNNFSSFFI